MALKVVNRVVGARRAAALSVSGIFTSNHLEGLRRMVPKGENIERAAVVWSKMSC